MGAPRGRPSCGPEARAAPTARQSLRPQPEQKLQEASERPMQGTVPWEGTGQAGSAPAPRRTSACPPLLACRGAPRIWEGWLPPTWANAGPALRGPKQPVRARRARRRARPPAAGLPGWLAARGPPPSSLTPSRLPPVPRRAFDPEASSVHSAPYLASHLIREGPSTPLSAWSFPNPSATAYLSLPPEHGPTPSRPLDIPAHLPASQLRPCLVTEPQPGHLESWSTHRPPFPSSTHVPKFRRVHPRARRGGHVHAPLQRQSKSPG